MTAFCFPVCPNFCTGVLKEERIAFIEVRGQKILMSSDEKWAMEADGTGESCRCAATKLLGTFVSKGNAHGVS